MYFKIFYLIALINFLNFNGCIANWDKVALRVHELCEGCHYMIDVASGNGNNDKVTPVNSLYGTITQYHEQIWRSNDSIVQSMDGNYAIIRGCLWTTEFNNRQHCFDKMEELIEDIEKINEGRRLIEENLNHRHLVTGFLIKLFGKAFRLAIKLKHAFGIVNAIQKIVRANKKTLLKYLYQLARKSASLHKLKLKQETKEILSSINSKLLQLTGKPIGFFQENISLTCNGKGKRHHMKFVYFLYKCT